jgi:NADH-quinone oxidoreductase subunit G
VFGGSLKGKAMSEVEIEIDGKKLTAAADAMVIQVADAAGIYIPRFCYHKLLTVAANCRMCLVEVEKSPKTLPACATPVTAGMKVFTRSPKALAAQKAVMEFLLINHPLDCPICDQGGECELQDLSMGFGSSNSYFHEGKRAVKDQDIGPLIQTDMTRCIQCTRCVRFGAEVAGMRELGAVGRGEDMEISTYVEHAMKSEVSGNVIDICPVGALTSKPFRYTARAWELEQRPTIGAHDCVGANLYAHTRNGVVMRMAPRENMQINQTWISDRDRFSYEGLYHPERITKPLIKKNGQWQETDWQTALEFTASHLASNGKGEKIGALASPNSTVEEFYLLQKILRGLGSSNVDHRLRQTDFSDQADFDLFPGLTQSFDELEQCDTILLVGCNIQKEAPSAFLRVRNAVRKGAQVLVFNPVDYAFSFDVAEKYISSPAEIILNLAGVAKALGAFNHGSETSEHAAVAKRWQESKKACVVLGNLAFNFEQAAALRAVCRSLTEKTGATLSLLTEGSNAAGAWLAGCVPHRGVAGTTLDKTGLNAQQMLEKPLNAYVLLNVEPDLDTANPVLASKALKQAAFVVSLSLFRNPVVDDCAHVILPIAPFTETAGTFVNAAGVWQLFAGVAAPFAESRPAWKILRVLGNLLHLEGFDYNSADEIHHELKQATGGINFVPDRSPFSADKMPAHDQENLYRIGSIPLYATDSLVRRAAALQKAEAIIEGDVASIHVHPRLAEKLQLSEGMQATAKQRAGQVRLPVKFDTRLPERSVYIAGGIEATSGLSELFGRVELQK